MEQCVEDVHSALDMLKLKYGITNSILVGWSFGGAVVITAGAQHAYLNIILTNRKFEFV